MLAFLLGLIAGIGTPTQASVNARIREDLKSPYITAMVSFISAMIILSVIILAVEKNLYIPLGTIAQQPFWIWLGGACGTTIIILNIVCVLKLGSAKNVMLICFGQVITGLIIDHFALFGAPEVSMSLMRLTGAVLVIISIVIVNGMGKDHERTSSSQWLYIFLAFICGFACSAQIAINGTLREFTGSFLKATLISMTVGLITTGIVSMILILFKGRTGIYDNNDPSGRKGFRWWMIIGGILAMIIVSSNAIAAPILGTGVVTILNLIGMMVAGLVIDATGFLGIDKKPVTFTKIVGMILMTAGTAVISLF